MPIFFTKKSCNRGVEPTPQMPLTVKAIKVLRGQKMTFGYISKDLNELEILLFTVLPTYWGSKNIP